MTKPFFQTELATLYESDVQRIPLPPKSVHCVVTSPPYWGLRDYGIKGQIGIERDLEAYIAAIALTGEKIWRVLRNDGTFWLNLGDSYSRNTGAKSGITSLTGAPWRVAFELQKRGWILRSAIVWHKPNPMPENVRNRPTSAYEMVFLFAKRPRYFYDDEAIKTASKDPGGIGRINARNVWKIATQPRPQAHFATFPDELPRRCILAGTSEKGVCAKCGAPLRRIVERDPYPTRTPRSGLKSADKRNGKLANRKNPTRLMPNTKTIGWEPTCDCNARRVPATVLDPFVGSGTTCAVATELSRRSIGLDLNPEYLAIAQKRLGSIAPILNLSL